MKQGSRKTVMVFGTFDRLHPGHVFFLKKAKALGDRLVVVVARDATAKKLKNRFPSQRQLARIRALRRLGIADAIVLGDKQLGSYGVFKKYRPAVICLGYDQQALARDLKKRLAGFSRRARPALRSAGALRPQQFKSSLRRPAPSV